MDRHGSGLLETPAFLKANKFQDFLNVKYSLSEAVPLHAGVSAAGQKSPGGGEMNAGKEDKPTCRSELSQQFTRDRPHRIQSVRDEKVTL
eukprot:8563285-Heterocapsa_arctica.AAC.1